MIKNTYTKKNRGFTLIESVIYIALLGLLITGAVVTAYELVRGASLVDAKNTANEEGVFVMRKVAWALSGAQTISSPITWGSSLTVSKYDGTTVDMRITGTAIEMRENGASFEPITTSNVTVSGLSFHAVPSVGGSPAGVEASTTINGVVFYTERFIRK
mgnify:CR=1 FL=1